MEKNIEVSTFYVGTQENANEIASEWNALLNTNEFYVVDTKRQDVHLIVGMVSEDDLDNFDIENEFMVNW